MRSVPEWIGKTDDTRIPPRVRMRIWIAAGGCCQGELCGRRILTGERWCVDHIIPLCEGGEHRESNLQILADCCHKGKSAAEMTRKARSDRMRLRHLGIKRPRKITRWRRFDGSPVYAGRER